MHRYCGAENIEPDMQSLVMWGDSLLDHSVVIHHMHELSWSVHRLCVVIIPSKGRAGELGIKEGTEKQNDPL